ncbi:MAG: DnaD domain protein [Eubacteriales bacterium]|nr:DnaD domain protein [Eubacteriales bacterium]MDD4390833.1 DnaD domain protein [Eubacteriales bacterium]
MRFKKEKTSTHYLYETCVENIYINEYMATAPGDYVKIYLFALMCLQADRDMSDGEIAEQLMMDEEQVKKAWEYWISLGVMRRAGKENSDLEFTKLRELLYGDARKNGDKSAEKQGALSDSNIRDMYKAIERAAARPLSGSEVVEISTWLDDFGVTPEMVVYAYTYCCGTLKKDNVKYIAKVVKEWAMKGLTDIAALDEHISKIDKMTFLYKRIFKALGFMRNPTEEEKRIMQIWFDELNLTIDVILDACSRTAGITNPNIKYIDKILKDWSKNGVKASSEGRDAIAPGMVIKYYDYLREKGEKEANARREKIYRKLPQIQDIESDIREKNMKMSRIMVSDIKNKTSEIKSINKEIENLRATKAAILTDNNYEADYMELKYLCMLCKDTGKTDNGEKCVCFSERTEEAKEWQSSTTKAK